MRILLDLFCGRWGWSKAFAARGWRCIGVDLEKPPEIPQNCRFEQADIIGMYWSTCGFLESYCGKKYKTWKKIDAIVASPPCQEFSVHGMKHFHPNPKYPANGIRLFEHTRALCEAAGVPYVIENVRAAQQFVGNAAHHCGPFYLWGNAVPPLMNQGIIKGMTHEALGFREFKGSPNWNRKHIDSIVKFGSKSRQRKEATAANATIPPELANCVAEYFERILEMSGSRA